MMSLEGKLIVALISAVVHHAVYLGSGPLSKALFKGLRYDYGEQRTWRSRYVSAFSSVICTLLSLPLWFAWPKCPSGFSSGGEKELSFLVVLWARCPLRRMHNHCFASLFLVFIQFA